MYAFHVSVYTQATLRMHVTIQHSAKGSLVNALVDNSESDESAVPGNQSSNMVIVECLTGETVWVQAVGDPGNLFVTAQYPSFSGYLIGDIA